MGALTGGRSSSREIDSADSPQVIAAAKKLYKHEPMAAVNQALGVVPQPFVLRQGDGYGRDTLNGRPTHVMSYDFTENDFVIVIFYADDETVCRVIPDPNDLTDKP
ncbi:MAG: hypothetical protein ACYC96_16080 [Fimbriimonadaceae bacterium]